MNPLKRFYRWLKYPSWYLEYADNFNAALDQETANLKELLAVCDELDVIIDESKPTQIYVNTQFMSDWRRLMGKAASEKLYWGIPLILKDQPEYFKV